MLEIQINSRFTLSKVMNSILCVCNAVCAVILHTHFVYTCKYSFICMYFYIFVIIYVKL